MEKIRTEDAVGRSLSHDVTAMYPGFKGALFKRGHVIKQEDIKTLLDIGKKNVYVDEASFTAEEGQAKEADAGAVTSAMLHEDDCALRLAGMAKISGAHYEGPSEGKVLLISDMRGMLRVNVSLLKQINNIADITIASLPDHSRVEEGDRLASMRIVPLFTEEERIREAEGLCEKNPPLFSLHPYKELHAGLIITGSEIYNGRIKDRFEPVIREKLSHFPGDIKGVRLCDDDMDMIEGAAGELMEEGADFLVFTGGMSVDPDDLTPGAVRRLGAEIISYGVPAQPGNMTLVAYLSDIPVIGVPGAAISLPATVFDVLLPQIYTGLRLTKQDMINLSDGGLCRMCGECHFPNCSFGRY